jgi:DNA-binding transcriptional regulator YhcF (GntR family)
MKWIASCSFQQKVAMAIEEQEEEKNESSKTKFNRKINHFIKKILNRGLVLSNILLFCFSP